MVMNCKDTRRPKVGDYAPRIERCHNPSICLSHGAAALGVQVP